MAANWQTRDDEKRVRTYRMRALVLGLASMGFALLGGLIARAGVLGGLEIAGREGRALYWERASSPPGARRGGGDNHL